MRSVLVALAFLAGCGSNRPVEQQYQRLEWARGSVHQANAECLAAVQQNPLLGFPTCMQAKGWAEVQ